MFNLKPVYVSLISYYYFDVYVWSSSVKLDSPSRRQLSPAWQHWYRTDVLFIAPAVRQRHLSSAVERETKKYTFCHLISYPFQLLFIFYLFTFPSLPIKKMSDLVACSQCFIRHPLEELSRGQQIFKVLI